MFKSTNFLNRVAFILGITCLGLFTNSCKEEEAPKIPQDLNPDNAKVVTVDDFNALKHDGQVVKIEGVQFVEQGSKFNTTGSNSGGSREVVQCSTGKTFIVFTEAGKPFSDEIVPDKMGDLVGTASKYRETAQLILSGSDAWKGMTNPLCDGNANVKTITVDQFNSGDFKGQIVKITGVQFTETGRKFNKDGSGAGGNLEAVQCSSSKKFNVYTSSGKPFASEQVPAKNGDIIGKVGDFKGTAQLEMRTKADYAGMTNDLCEVKEEPGAVVTTVKEARDAFAAGTTTFGAGSKITVVVTSDRNGGNVNSKAMFAQDETAGIGFFLPEAHTFDVGDELEINLEGATLGDYNNLVQIKDVAADKITKKSTNKTVTPEVITIADLNSGKYQGKLVKIVDVTIASGKTFNGNVNFTKGEETGVLRTGSGAAFASETVPSGSSITVIGNAGVFKTTNQILPRTKNDVVAPQ